MMRSISDCLPKFNKILSNSTNESVVTTHKPTKLHSSDIAYLKVVRFFTTRGKNGKCHLTKGDWPVWLERFGGKSVCYRVQKTRWAKMRAAGYVVTKHCRGNRNKELDHYITMDGIAALREFEEKSTRRPRVFDECPTSDLRVKNSPSKTEKQPLENEKTAPPLNVWIKEDKKEEEFYSYDERKQIIQRQRKILQMMTNLECGAI